MTAARSIRPGAWRAWRLSFYPADSFWNQTYALTRPSVERFHRIPLCCLFVRASSAPPCTLRTVVRDACQRLRIVRASAITASPRPLMTAFNMWRLKLGRIIDANSAYADRLGQGCEIRVVKIGACVAAVLIRHLKNVIRWRQYSIA